MADAKVKTDGTIIEASKGFQRMTGQNINDVLSGSDSLEQKIETAKGLTGAKTVEIVDGNGNTVKTV